MAAGAGLTATLDLSITNTFVGHAGGYTSPTTNGLYAALFNTPFTAAAKSGATEWSAASDTSYVRVNLTTGGWTIAAYASSTGVVFSNTSQVSFPAVAGANQTLSSVGFGASSTVGTADIALFADLSANQAVNIGIQVILPATSPGPAGITYTTY